LAIRPHQVSIIISALLLACTSLTFAEGTRTWEQSKFDEFIKGTPKGIAIRSTGGLELAPAFKAISTTPATYIWSLAADSNGVVYAGTGSPARVYRITPDGHSEVMLEPQELQVQALMLSQDGNLFAATNPDGKVYKIDTHPSVEPPLPGGVTRATPGQASWTSSIYFDPHTKYIWDMAMDPAGNLFVATGDHGEIFRVAPNGQHTVFFKSDEPHIRVLGFDHQGNLIAGSDGSGLVYRISARGDGFVLYSAPKKEITALAVDSAGNIYAAGVGEKRGATLPIMPAPSINPPTITPGSSQPIMSMGTTTASTAQPVSGPAIPSGGFGASGGSEVYRIAPDGSPSRLWTSHDDLVYALAFDSQGRLLAGTGNRGHIFAIGKEDEFIDLAKASASQVTAFAKAAGGGFYVSTSNLGKIFLLSSTPEPQGTYESDVLDAHIFSRWGRVQYRGAGNVELYARSGNVDNPDRNWSPWTKIDMLKAPEMTVPPARFIQWKAVLHSGNPEPFVDSVSLNYLPKNVAPDFDDVDVEVGIRYQALPKTPGLDNSSSPPPPPIRDRDSVGVKWTVHDDNDDQLVYSLYYRGDGESRWLLLKDDIADKFYSFDAALLPDGGYTLKVVASDAPSHTPGEQLSAEKTSDRFEVDTTPPQIQSLGAALNGSQLRISFRAVDGFSAIKRAEYSVDAGDWQFVEPVGQLSDAKLESYDFTAPLPSDPPSPVQPAAAHAAEMEHVVVVRAYDRYDNLATAKFVVKAGTSAPARR
jgi:WD40 repeat protein